MFGQKPAFGAAPAAGGFGTSTAGFGAAPGTSAATSFGTAGATFGSTAGAAPAFGAATAFGQPAAAPAAGGLFSGAAQPAATTGAGGLFGQPAAASTSFGATAGAGGAFGGAASTFGSSAFGKPAGAAGSFTGFGAAPAATSTAAGGLFGAPAATSTAGGLFGATTGATTAFGAPTAAPAAGGAFGFGQPGAAAAAPNGTTVKFAPPTGTDTMMKSGVTTNINTRHQCITCMKEYEAKSLEELRCEDYLANRKQGGAAGAAGAAPGLFGAPPNQTAGAGGFFGAPAASTQSTMFGAQQQKPLFGGAPAAATSTAFGAPAAAAAPAFGAPAAASTAGGLFGKPAFGAATTTSTAGAFGGFGAQPAASTGGLFGQTQPNKPMFGAAGTTTTQAGGLFGSTATTGFGAQAAQPAFGQAGAATTGFGGFGAAAQPQAAAPGSIGLFGQPQAKPAGTFAGFGATATSTAAAPAFGAAAPAAGGFGAPAAQTNMFGGQPKPAFAGFGAAAATSTPSFGGFGAAAQTTQAGGLFGAPKPALSFGATTTQAAPAFGGFGAATQPAAGGTLFGGTAAQKPGGLFGGTGTFGAPGSTFGATTSTGFGAGLGTGLGATAGGGMFGGAAAQAQPHLQQPSQAANPIQQQLVQLASSPYGDNPLFKNLTDPGKREDILKPINPAAQKALDSSAQQYKVSPHRNIKARAKPISSLGNKSAIFEGLEDDDVNPGGGKGGDTFVPRSSVKKLVLKLSLKSPRTPSVDSPSGQDQENVAAGANTSSLSTGGRDQSLLDQSQLQQNRSADESLHLPAVKSLGNKDNNVSIVDDSFAVLNPQKNKNKDDNKKASPAVGGDVSAAPTTADVSIAGSEELELDEGLGPADVVLRRSGYYTMPALADLSAYVDEGSGSCLVENFTVGRRGYGNVFFPGVTNVAGLNLDEIVFIRHKEVIVYPDDGRKPPLGEGLNKKAQITLDKVWPVDKASKASIRDPDALAELGYEDKLRKACIKLGARFVEYRPETGSWVFKVDHFSKYGLDDSDEEEGVKKTTEVKKLKTLQLREPMKPAQQQQQVAGGEKTKDGILTTSATVHRAPEERAKSGGEEVAMDDAPRPPSNLSPPQTMQQHLTRLNNAASSNKVQLMKAASLFDDDEEEDSAMAVDGGVESAKSRPVILQSRPTVLERRQQQRDPLIEDIAHAMLTGSTASAGRGLGGSFSLEQPAPTVTSSLLRSRFLAAQGAMFEAAGNTSSSFLKHSFTAGDSSALSGRGRVPTYSLHSAYEKFVVLPSSGPAERTKAVVPKCFGRMPPPHESLFAGRLRSLADAGLSSGRRFRVGWAGNWVFANPGCPTQQQPFAREHLGYVNIEQVTISSYGSTDEQQLRLLESWLELSLEYSSVEMEDSPSEDGPGPASAPVPRIAPSAGLDSLHAHAQEASKQLSDAGSAPESFGRALREVRRVWDLCVALWGRLEEQDIFAFGPDSHEVTLLRREAVSRWLAEAVAPEAERDLRRAAEGGDAVGEVLAMLSGDRLAEACQRAQENGDHHLALLMAIGGGANSEKGQLLLQQMDRWQEMRVDEFISEDRLRLYATAAGVPVWPGSREEEVNVCKGLDWKRCLGQHLWHLTSPVASVADAFLGYEEAFKGEEPYAAKPIPDYLEGRREEDYGSTSNSLDVKYHLLKLYTDRSHPLEVALDPGTHTPDPLDFRVSWFLAQVLRSLGYVHMSDQRSDSLHLSFAAQLESLGLWHWAVFVLLHLSDPFLRRARVTDCLGRKVRLSDEDCADREEFLRRHLRVPSQWVAEAKATRARAVGNPRDRAFYLSRAGMWREAHQVLVKDVAPDAVANDDHGFLLDLLRDLSAPGAAPEHVPEWHLQGQVFLDFLDVDAEVRDLLERRKAGQDEEESLGYEIERLRPRVTSLCGRVGSLPSSTAKERLCQSEIAKKVAHIMRALLKLDTAAGGGQEGDAVPARILEEQLSDLPMPDDCNLEELRALTRSYMMENIGRRYQGQEES